MSEMIVKFVEVVEEKADRGEWHVRRVPHSKTNSEDLHVGVSFLPLNLRADASLHEVGGSTLGLSFTLTSGHYKVLSYWYSSKIIGTQAFDEDIYEAVKSLCETVVELEDQKTGSFSQEDNQRELLRVLQSL